MEAFSLQAAGLPPGALGEGDAERLFSIGAIAREFGISLRALRFYEDRGLLNPRRRGSIRYYSARDRLHVQMILKGKRLGFTLRDIRDMLAACGDALDARDLELGLDPERILAQIRRLERQRADLDRALDELRAAHQRAEQARRPDAR